MLSSTFKYAAPISGNSNVQENHDHIVTIFGSDLTLRIHGSVTN